VTSSIVLLTPAEAKPVADRELLDLIVRSAFRSRRKTLRNNILAASSELLAKSVELPAERVLTAFRDAGIDPSQRAEECPVEVYRNVVNRLAELRDKHKAEPPTESG
jgi:16S rRNA A1518/A1519 N6-dimethyltransferase RsmA/KsgA/DIM1 with predicted DNA glycosylase/AP lyase activity